MQEEHSGGWRERSKVPRFSILLMILGIIVAFSPTWAAEYPSRPIEMVVCYAPGSGGDFGSRMFADRIEKYLGQSIISVYKPGGGGTLGAAFVAKAKPDGYTLLVGSTTPLVLAGVFKKLDFRMEDFILLGGYAKGLLWLAVKPDSRWKTLKDLVNEAKKSPGKILTGTFGKQSSSDICRLLLNKYAGIDLVNVPFKSSSEEITALLGGHIDAAFISSPGAHLESKTIRILAVAEPERLPVLPDIPTYNEYGYPVLLSNFYTLCFPKGTPKEIVNRFLDAQRKAMQNHGEEINKDLKKVEQLGMSPNPEETVKIFLDVRKRVTEIAQELGSKAR